MPVNWIEPEQSRFNLEKSKKQRCFQQNSIDFLAAQRRSGSGLGCCRNTPRTRFGSSTDLTGRQDPGACRLVLSTVFFFGQIDWSPRFRCRPHTPHLQISAPPRFTPQSDFRHAARTGNQYTHERDLVSNQNVLFRTFKVKRTFWKSCFRSSSRAAGYFRNTSRRQLVDALSNLEALYCYMYSCVSGLSLLI